VKQQLEQVASDVGRLPQRHQAAFVLTCAERVAPAFLALADTGSVPTYREAMRAAWAALASTTAADGPPQETRSAVAELPEADLDDSNRPEFYAGTAMYPLQVALAMLAGEAPDDAVRSACFSNVDLCAELEAGTDLRFVAHDAPLDYGPLEAVELAAQLGTLRILQNAPRLTAALAEQLRQQAVEVSQTLATAVERFAGERGWSNK
jgi:hypothetical protein